MIARRFRCCLLLLVFSSACIADTSHSESALKAASVALQADDPVSAEKLLRPLAEGGQADAQHLLGFLYDLGLAVPMDYSMGNSWQEKAADQGHYWARLYLGWKLALGLGVDKPDPERSNTLHAVLYEQTAPARVVPEEWLGAAGLRFIPNHRRAGQWLRSRAEAGDALASFTLAEYYYAGWIGGRKDAVSHVRWMQASADHGYAPAMVRLKLYYGLGEITEKDEARSREYLRRAAEAGDAESQYELGRNHARGQNGMPKDRALARDWYARAAARDHIAAINALADLLRAGVPPDGPDFSEALRLSQRAASLGNVEALSDIAGMLRRGEGTAKDLTGAFQFYRDSAEKNHAFGAHMVGWMITYGEAGERDYAEARRWFERAAAGGNTGSLREIGLQYSEGRGTPVDQAEAFTWFERAARDGDSWAQNRVGWMLLNGTGVPQDTEEAVSWFRLASNQKNITAISNLIDVLTKGADGVPQDLPEVFRLANVAADLGEAWAQNRVGWMLLKGEGAVADHAAAFRWFTQAAAKQNTHGFINLGTCYENGIGTAEDPTRAADCFRQALTAGQQFGLAHLARVSLKLPPSEQVAVFREITPLIVERAPKAESWELGFFAGVLLHNDNPLGDRGRGKELLERVDDARFRAATRPRSPPKVPIKLD